METAKEGHKFERVQGVLEYRNLGPTPEVPPMGGARGSLRFATRYSLGPARARIGALGLSRRWREMAPHR